MLPFKTLIQIDKSSKWPVYQQIATRFIGLIQEGVLKPGSFLPGSRVMAELLVVHRQTVVAAYEELASQDWIVPMARKGMMIATNLPVIKPRSFKSTASAYAEGPGFSFGAVPQLATPPPAKDIRYVINDGFPDVRLAPLGEWTKECRSIIQSPRYLKLLVDGSDTLRLEMIKYLTNTRGLNISPENIMITRGAQMAIYTAAALLIKKGDHVIVGSPNYIFADLCFEQLGANILRVPVDSEGIDVNAIEKLCKTKKIRMLYVVPHHHHPTTVTLSAERRMKLLEIIRTYKLAVIEDDYDYDFHYSSAPILPLASADHGGNVMYIGSLTKSLGLSLRIGFLIAPARFITEASHLRRLMDLRGDNLTEEALAAMLASGAIERHLKKAKKIYHERRDLLCSLLEDKLGDVLTFTPPSGGLALWLKFPKSLPLPEVAERALGMGLRMSAGGYYKYVGEFENALRFGFATFNHKELTAVVGILAKCVR